MSDLWVLSLLLIALVNHLHAQEVATLVVFGDSLSDNGNGSWRLHKAFFQDKDAVSMPTVTSPVPQSKSSQLACQPSFVANLPRRRPEPVEPVELGVDIAFISGTSAARAHRRMKLATVADGNRGHLYFKFSDCLPR